MLGFSAALLFVALLVMEPNLCRAWAQGALADWALAVAPALLPFFVALPYLTGEDARSTYRALLSWLARPFGLPGEAAGVMAVGFLAGSPAGAAAQRSMGEGLTRAQGLRLSVLASGAGPVFYISFVGGALLGNPAAGRALYFAQMISAALAACLLRAVFRDERPLMAAPPAPGGGGPISRAVGQVLSIGGYMVFFAILGNALAEHLGPAWKAPVMSVMEMTGAARAISEMALPQAWKLSFLGAACCFGGASICGQSLDHLRPLGIGTLEYGAAKLMHAALNFWTLQALFNRQYIPLGAAFFACLALSVYISRQPSSRASARASSSATTPSEAPSSRREQAAAAEPSSMAASRLSPL